jgi:hypothetical protein
MYQVNFNVNNALNTPSIAADTFANRPTVAATGAVYIATDTGSMYRYNGTAWTSIGGGGVSGTGTATYIPYWSSSSALATTTLTFTTGGGYPTTTISGTTTTSIDLSQGDPSTSGQAAGFVVRRQANSKVMAFILGKDTLLNAGTPVFNIYAQDDLFLKIFGSTDYYHSFYKNGNIVLNGYTDAGYKLDIQGTGRINNTLRIDGTAGYTADLFTCYINGGTVAAFKIDMYGRTFITNAGVNAVAAVIGSNTTFGQNSSNPAMYSGNNSNNALGFWNGVKTSGLPTFDTGATSGWCITVDNGNNGSYNELTIGGTMLSGQQASKNLITIDQFANNGTMVFGSTAGAQTYTLVNCPIAVNATTTGKILRFIRYNPTISGTALAGHYAATFASGQIGIGTETPTATALVEMISTTQGLKVPIMTTTQKNAIANTAGLIVFDSTLAKLCINSGSGWQTITSV